MRIFRIRKRSAKTAQEPVDTRLSPLLGGGPTALKIPASGHHHVSRVAVVGGGVEADVGVVHLVEQVVDVEGCRQVFSDLIALSFLLIPLLRGRRAQREEDRTALNVALYQERQAELQAQYDDGVLTPQQLEDGRAEAALVLQTQGSRESFNLFDP